MKKKSLLDTNPYLKNSQLRKKLFERSVISSTAIEGVHITFSHARKKQKSVDQKKL